MIEATTALGQPAMRLRAPDGAEATVLLYGAHLVSWKPAGGPERLYLSPTAVAGGGRAVRGGVPIVFPQFNLRGSLPCKHGFLRDRDWAWAEGATRAGAAIGVLQCRADEATRALWPHAFAAEFTVAVSGGTLDMELAITNEDAQPFEFQAALHTYLRLDDLLSTRLHGLGGVAYEDAVHGGWHRQEFDTIGFAGEIDRIYSGISAPLTLSSGLGRLGIDHDGFDDAVVWNPGPDKAAALPDLPDEDWRHMLCVEAAAVQERIRLEPGAMWSARQSLLA